MGGPLGLPSSHPLLDGGTRGKLCFVPGEGSTPGPVAKVCEVLWACEVLTLIFLVENFTTAPGGLSVGCLPTGRGQKRCARERGQRVDKELRLWKPMNADYTLDSARH